MQEGIEKVEAAYAVFFKNSLEDFQHFSFELQTVAEQNLTAERIKSYLAIIHQHREIEETYKVTKGILLVLGKYLQMMVAYRIFKEDNVELQVASLYETFNDQFEQLCRAFEDVTGTLWSLTNVLEVVPSGCESFSFPFILNVIIQNHFRELLIEMPESREKVLKKQQHSIKRLGKAVAEKDVAVIPLWIEQVEKSWEDFEKVELEFKASLEEEDKIEEVMEVEVYLAKQREEKKKAICEARDAMESKQEVSIKEDHVGECVSQKLSKVRVNKKDFEEYQTALKDRLVKDWTETSMCKVFNGVEIANYPKFLDTLQKSADFDDKIRGDLEQLHYTDNVRENYKAFTCKETKNSGSFGMYMAVKRPHEVSQATVIIRLGLLLNNVFSE